MSRLGQDRPHRHSNNTTVGSSESPWRYDLTNRIDRTTCGCGRRFDPVTKCELIHCQNQPATLLQMSRKTMLKAVGLKRIHHLQDPMKTKMPKMMVKELCNLHFADFHIDLYSVQNTNVRDGIYKAKVSFSGQEVLLHVHKQETFKYEDCQHQPDYITSFQDKGLWCVVKEPTMTLWAMLKTYHRLGQPLPYCFMWKIIRDIATHIAVCSTTHNLMKSSSEVKIMRTNKAFIDQDNNFEPGKQEDMLPNFPPPPEKESLDLISGYSSEKASVWSLGCLVLEMLTVGVNNQDRPIRGKRPPAAFLPQAKTHQGKIIILKDLPQCPLKNLLDKCLNQNPSKRPRANEILSEAQMILREF